MPPPVTSFAPALSPFPGCWGKSVYSVTPVLQMMKFLWCLPGKAWMAQSWINTLPWPHPGSTQGCAMAIAGKISTGKSKMGKHSTVGSLLKGQRLIEVVHLSFSSFSLHSSPWFSLQTLPPLPIPSVPGSSQPCRDIFPFLVARQNVFREDTDLLLAQKKDLFHPAHWFSKMCSAEGLISAEISSSGCQVK